MTHDKHYSKECEREIQYSKRIKKNIIIQLFFV